MIMNGLAGISGLCIKEPTIRKNKKYVRGKYNTRILRKWTNMDNMNLVFVALMQLIVKKEWSQVPTASRG